MRQTLDVMSGVFPSCLAIGTFMNKNTQPCQCRVIITCVIGRAAKKLVFNAIFHENVIENSAKIHASVFPSNILKGKEGFTKAKLIIDPMYRDSYAS
jgi:hypothetical protein